MGGVTGSISLNGLVGGGDFISTPGSLGLSDAVNFSRANSVDVSSPETGDYFPSQTFSVTVLNSRDIADPTNIYQGTIDPNGIDGLTITEGDDANDIVLTYSPPMPPDIAISFDLPTRPDFDITRVAMPGSNTDTSLLAVMPAIFDVLETEAARLVDDILVNLSTNAVTELNDIVSNGSPQSCLSLRGLPLQGSTKADVLAARQKASLARELLILNRRVNNTTVSVSVVDGINGTKAEAHKIGQQARLDDAKLNVFIATQNLFLSIALYNAEVQRALVEYSEFEQMTSLEIKKLELYKHQIQSAGGAMAGNSELAQAYRKQLSVVEQVFSSFESSMKLSEMTVKLATAQIKVETENIRTGTMLIDGDASQAQNRAFQAKTTSMAHGLNNEAEIAKRTTDSTVDRTKIAKDLLGISKVIKNNLIDSDNDFLKATANSVSTKIRNVQNLFDIDNLKYYNDVYLSFLASHHKDTMRNSEQQQKVYDVRDKIYSKTRAASEESKINSAQRTGWDTRVRGFDSHLTDTDEAAKILSTARTQQELLHTISS